MKYIKVNILSLLLFCGICLNAQKSIYPKDVTEHCKLSKKQDGTITIKCGKLPIELNGPRGKYEILQAVKGKRKFNLICKGKIDSIKREFIVLITANKINGKWKQKNGRSINAPNKIGVEQKVEDYFFPDINTLFLSLEFSQGEKEGFLVRLTNDNIKWYKPTFNPFEEVLDYSPLPKKYLDQSPRPKY